MVNPFPDESVRFARLLGAELVRSGMHFSRHHAEPIRGEGRALIDPQVGVYRYNGLTVLARTRAPAALLESGLIVNREDELALSSSETRSKIASAISAAVGSVLLDEASSLPLDAVAVGPVLTGIRTAATSVQSSYFCSVARPKIATNGNFQRISAPGLCGTFSNVRTRSAFRSSDQSDDQSLLMKTEGVVRRWRQGLPGRKCLCHFGFFQRHTALAYAARVWSNETAGQRLPGTTAPALRLRYLCQTAPQGEIC